MPAVRTRTRRPGDRVVVSTSRMEVPAKLLNRLGRVAGWATATLLHTTHSYLEVFCSSLYHRRRFLRSSSSKARKVSGDKLMIIRTYYICGPAPGSLYNN